MTTYQKLFTENQYNDNNLGIIEHSVNNAINYVSGQFQHENIFGIDEKGFVQGKFDEQPTEIQEVFDEKLAELVKEHEDWED